MRCLLSASVRVALVLVVANVAVSVPAENDGPETVPTESSACNQAQVAPTPCLNTDLATNKQIVKDFYQKVFGDKKFDLADKYVAQDVINHNPMEVDGIDGLRSILKGPFGQGPPFKVDIKRISAEDDLVWTHSRVPFPALNATYAIMDVFRISCAGLIQEHWDVLQDINVETKNPHPFF